MKAILYCVISILTFSCNSQNNHENPNEFKEKLVKLHNPTKRTYQKFINEATEVVRCVNNDPNCKVDFDKITELLDSANNANVFVLVELSKIEEIDKEINYKINMEAYWTSSMEVLKEFKKWFEVLKKTREVETINKYYKNVFDKLKAMKEKELIFKQSQEDYNKKYKL